MSRRSQFECDQRSVPWKLSFVATTQQYPKVLSGLEGCDLPARENKHGGVAFQRYGECLCPFDPEVDAIILDRGDGRLRDSGERGQFRLAEFLQFPHDAERLPDRDLNGFACFAITFHFIFSGSRGQ